MLYLAESFDKTLFLDSRSISLLLDFLLVKREVPI